MLVKIPEHTWGLPSINVNGKNDNVNWRNVEFEKARASGPFRAGYTDCHEGWREQRLFNDYALALKDIPYIQKLKRSVDNVRVPYTKPALNEYNNVGLSKETFVCGNVKLAFDTVHGGLSFLEIDNKIWVDSTTSPEHQDFYLSLIPPIMKAITIKCMLHVQLLTIMAYHVDMVVMINQIALAIKKDAQLKRHLSLFYNLYTFVNEQAMRVFA